MKPNQLMDQFEALAKKLGFKIIHGKGDFTGGGCILVFLDIIRGAIFLGFCLEKVVELNLV